MLHPDGTTDPEPAVALQADSWQESPEIPLAGPSHSTTAMQKRARMKITPMLVLLHVSKLNLYTEMNARSMAKVKNRCR